MKSIKKFEDELYYPLDIMLKDGEVVFLSEICASAVLRLIWEYDPKYLKKLDKITRKGLKDGLVNRAEDGFIYPKSLISL